MFDEEMPTGRIEIYTASFYHCKSAPGRISIARRAPKGMTDLPAYRALAPGGWFNSVSEEEYRRRYFGEILDKLDPMKVIRDLQALVAPNPPVMLCWERLNVPSEWCHRQMVREWLMKTVGVEAPEIRVWPPPADVKQKALF